MTDQPDKLIYSGPELYTLEYGPVEWYLENYIPTEGIVLLFGKYGVYKTPIIMNMAKAIEAGADELWGLKVQKASPVLFISADTPPRIVHPRMLKMGLVGSTGLDVALNAYPGIDVVNLQAPTEEARKARDLGILHQNKRYKVVFVDSLRAIHHLDDKESGNIRQVYGALASIFYGATIVIIHHERKASAEDTEEMRDEGFSGSQALMNHATVGIRVIPQAVRKGKVKLRHVKSQAGPLQHDLELTVVDEIAKVDENAFTYADVRKVLEEAEKRNFSAGDTDLLISERLGVSTRTARRLRKKMDEIGHDWNVVSSSGTGT